MTEQRKAAETANMIEVVINGVRWRYQMGNGWYVFIRCQPDTGEWRS